MKVSFVIPVYKKTAEQLKKCLKSLKTQSHRDIEIICVFDGSDPDLEKVAYEQEVKISVIEHGGAPKARNAGAKLATGDVIAFWDADCYAEPEMTSVWVMTFKDNPDCDFVYSGYKWTDPGIPGFDSEPFDPWTLSKYNYIASMFPLKKEKVLQWDESLKGLQDWDYWRRVVEAGSKGRFIPGYGFSTDYPDGKGISGNPETTKERILKIREKHGDPKADLLVYGGLYRREATHLAKLVKGDYFNHGFWRVNDYKAVLMVGFHPWELKENGSLFQQLPASTKKIIYWMGLDSEMLYNAPYFEVKMLIQKLKETIGTHLCDGERTRKILADMGIEAEILPFPREDGEILDTLPPKVKVLALADEAFRGHLQAIIAALPTVEFTTVVPETGYNLKEYTAGIQFTNYPRLLNASQKVLMEGRYMISNVQEPYSGYVDPSDITKFKEGVISKILALRGVTDLNKEAQDYYLQTCDPQKFRDEIGRHVGPVLEVVS